jgi:ParB/RepB/Spo0J family partition protein
MNSARFEHLAVNLVVASLTNPRKHFDPDKLRELSESIRASGVHQAVLVRPLPAHRLQGTVGMKPRPTYELVAGERRHRACSMAGLATIPAMIRELDDNQVREVQIIENLQRDDLTELEEAEGYEQLMEHTGLTVDQVGEKIGKSRSYVYARLKLLNLCPEGRQAMRDGWLPASHALLIARMPSTKLQIDALDNMRDYSDSLLPYREASALIQRQYMLTLVKAPFDATDAELVPGAPNCFQCPKRTGADPDLFADVKGVDTCTDIYCYRGKEEAQRLRVRAQAEARGLDVIDGREARALIPYGWDPRVEGHLRLDSKEDSPTGVPLRKLIGKDMQEQDVKEVLVANPHKEGELIACLPTAVAMDLLKSANLKGTNAEKAAATVEALTESEARREKAEAEQAKTEAKRDYEKAWRWLMLEETWGQIRTGTHEPWDGLLRHIALDMAQRLNTDDSKRLCKLLDLGKVAPKEGLQQWVKDLPDAHMALQLLVMFNGVEYHQYYEDAFPDREANTGLKLVAAQYDVTPESVQDRVKKAVRAATKAAKAAEKAANATSPDGPAAQADGGRGGESQNETSAGKKPGKRKAQSKARAAPALTPEEAMLGIAAAMQCNEAGAESGPGESGQVGGAAAEESNERPAAVGGVVA